MEPQAAPIGSFADVDRLRTCEQCGCCASACPITNVERFNVRRIVRHIELDLVAEIADTPFPWACTTCGRCETVCPNGIAILDIIRPLRRMAPEQFTPPGPAPCAQACPAGIDVPGYLRLIASGRPEEAYRLILEEVPFPGVLGRVCPRPCENRCRRGEVNTPIAICALKRFAADQASAQPPEGTIAPDTGRRVAVVGAGPAGLTAAYCLRKKGHRVTVFEERPLPGGMLRYGIPAYRLPAEVLEQEIERILALGIELRTATALGKDLRLKTLTDDFDAVFLALGLQRSRRIELENGDLEDVLWGLDFLSAVNTGQEIGLKERVLVIGGGNVAMDVAMAARRRGACALTVACLEAREDMPASAWEIETALEEGVELLAGWGARRILAEDGQVTGVELVRCTAVFDSEGRFHPTYGDETRTVAADQVILAVGQATDLSCLGNGDECSIQNGLIRVDPETLATDVAGVFAGGDAASGPGAVVEAIAAGKRGARAIDRVLGGDGELFHTPAERADTRDYTGERERGFADRARLPTPALPVQERLGGFVEIEQCFSPEQAVAEAGRCLQCDLELTLGKGAEP